MAVADTGRGIAPEACSKIFERLYQEQTNTDAGRRGLGLGLFISRELVVGQGGRIWVESRLGKGSTFYFTLPVFSLARLCAPVLTERNLQAGSVALIAVEARPLNGSLQARTLRELRKLLERCILPSQDVLLPQMGGAESAETAFIVACTERSGAEVVAQRVREQVLDSGRFLDLEPVISLTTLDVPAASDSREWEARIGDVTTRIDQLVQAHLKQRRIV